MAIEKLSNNHPIKNLDNKVKEDYIKGLVFIVVEGKISSEEEKKYITSLMKILEIDEMKLSEFESFAEEPDEDELVVFIERIKNFNKNIKLIFLIESFMLRHKNGELTEEDMFNEYLEILDLQDKKDAIIYLAEALISKDKDLTFSLDTIEKELEITIDNMQKAQQKEDINTLSESNDKNVIDWKNVKCIMTINEYDSPVHSVVFSPDGKLIASDGEDIKIWDIENNKCIQTLRGHDGMITSVSCSKDGEYIASGSNDKTIKIWKDGRCVQTLEDADVLIADIVFSPNGKYIASAGRGPIRIWENGECVEELSHRKHKGTYKALALSPDGEYIATSGVGSKSWFQIWENEECIESQSLSKRIIDSITFSPDGEYIVSGDNQNNIDIWENGKCIKTLEGHGDTTSIVFSKDGKYMITSGSDKTIKIWEDEKCIATLNEHNSTVYSVAISADGKYIASGSADRTVKIWEGQA